MSNVRGLAVIAELLDELPTGGFGLLRREPALKPTSAVLSRALAPALRRRTMKGRK